MYPGLRALAADAVLSAGATGQLKLPKPRAKADEDFFLGAPLVAIVRVKPVYLLKQFDRDSSPEVSGSVKSQTRPFHSLAKIQFRSRDPAILES